MSKLSGKTIVIIAAAAALVLLLILFLMRDKEPQPVAPVPQPAPAEEADTQLTKLPPLEESDEFAWSEITMMSGIVGTAGIDQWRPVDNLLLRVVGITANAAEGQVVRKQLEVFGPDAPFPVMRKGNELYMDPAGYRRFDGPVQFLARQSPELVVALYNTLEPLLQMAYRQLGRQGPVKAVVKNAIGRVLQAPLIETDIPLLRKSVVYHYKDPALESLDPVARQMLRVGPDNTRLIQEQLRRINNLL